MKRSLVSFGEYLLLLFFIIEFNTPYTYFQIAKSIVGITPLLILAFLLLMKVPKVKIDLLILALWAGALLPSLNVADGQMLRFVRLYVLLLPMLVIYLTTLLKEDSNSIHAFFLKFSNIVVFLAVISLFFWIFGSLLEKISYTMLIPNAWGYEKLIPTYYGIYFETQHAIATASQESAMIRNSGIFNEAPMYNMVLCTALAIECFFRAKCSRLRIFILVVTLLSTISTTGYIFMVLLLAVKLYSAISIKHRMLFLVCSPIILLGVFLAVSVILENKKETGEKSYDSRSADILKCIEAGLDNPVLGVEIFHSADGFSLSRKNDYGYSNSLFGIFAHGGFYTLALYLFALLFAPWLTYRRLKQRDVLFFSWGYLLLFTFTVSEYKYLTILMMAVGLAYWDVVCLQKKVLPSTVVK